MNATKCRWVRLENGSRELREPSSDGSEYMVLALVEPACTRRHYWWTTWGHTPDVGGYAFSLKDAISLAEYHARESEAKYQARLRHAEGGTT